MIADVAEATELLEEADKRCSSAGSLRNIPRVVPLGAPAAIFSDLESSQAAPLEDIHTASEVAHSTDSGTSALADDEEAFINLTA